MRSERGLDRLALAAAVATFFLLTIGGFVTSLDAGMVFLDWPLSNGSINPDGWLFDPKTATEHGHRILGWIVGMLTLPLAIGLQRRDPRRHVRVLGWVAVAFVALQGLLGGMRVRWVSTEMAQIHGITGQAYFALMVALVYFRSRDAATPGRASAPASRLAVCAAATLLVVFAQIAVGARLRHVGGPIADHLVGAVLTGGTIAWLVTLTMLRHRDDRALVRPVLALATLVLVQVGLGLASNAVLRDYWPFNPTPIQVLLPSAHQVAGALLLALTTLVFLRAAHRARVGAQDSTEVFA
jgi:cytochrome c oxidase assembly protein subunit 15